MSYSLIPTTLLAGALTLLPYCNQKPAEAPPQVLARYAADADAFCKAIVECIKEDVAARMDDRPERRDMILDRMDRDLCIDGQKKLLGKLSVDPAGKDAGYIAAQYEAYGACTKAVVAAENCEDRRTTHKTDPACVKLREFQK